MSPIRVGIIGVGAVSDGGPGAWGAISHLPALLASPHYKLVAIANSSIESAKASIAYHKLDSNIKAYGSAEEIAQDPEIDLAVVSVVVAKHYAITKLLISAGKDVYAEWPLAVNTSEIEELADLAKSHNVKTIIGTQGRALPLTTKLRELINSGKIGKVLSSVATGTFLGVGVGVFPASARYLFSKDSGGNHLTILFGHFFDTFIHVLGNFASLHSITKIAYPTVDLIDKDGTIVESNYSKTAADHVFVHGLLESDAMASINFRQLAGPTASGAGIRWTITGTEGEIEITTPENMWQSGAPGATLKIRVGKDGKSEDVDFENEAKPEHIKTLSLWAQGVGSTWEAYTKGETEKYGTFEDARAVHRILDAVREGSF